MPHRPRHCRWKRLRLEYHVARYVADVDAVYNYEGSDAVQSFIVGCEVTGVIAFV